MHASKNDSDEWYYIRSIYVLCRPIIMTYFPLRQQGAGSSTFVVHFPGRAMVVVTDPEAIKEIAMQPKNEKTRSFLSIFATLFGERLYFMLITIIKALTRAHLL